MRFLPSYDELWVVSDIHMGGERRADRNFQIFRRGARLAAMIDRLRTVRPAEQVCLVLNGDIIDSLAEEIVEGYVALDVATAEAMMERIYEDPAFAPVWHALARFVRTAGRHLVFVLGNHDIELALPSVEASVRHRLAPGDPAADARVVFATRGGGFACKVGGARVFCTHGNEVDAWNDVDYSDLGQLANAMNAARRADPERWSPNAGTRLVIDVMNKVKRQHPFVDLLKPEIKPVLGVLLTLQPGLLKELTSKAGAVASIAAELVRGNRRVGNLLSAAGAELEDVPATLMAHAFVEEALGSSLKAEIESVRSDGEDRLLVDAELALTRPELAPRAPEAEGTLGATDIVAGWLRLVGKAEGLRRALQDWMGDAEKAFRLHDEDETYQKISARVGPEVDFVVTGHTHLARAIPREAPRYFNCGTWIRLLRITPEALKDRNTFEQQVYRMLEAGSMDALDGASIPGAGGPVPLVLDRTNAVQITSSAKGVTGALLRVVDDDGEGSNLDFVPETGGLQG